MKTKNLLGIASILVFAAALLLGVTVAGILFLGRLQNDESEASLANNTSNETPSNEFVILYDSANQDLARVNISDGSSEIIDLGFNAPEINLWNKAVSSDGRYFAFCTVEHEADGSGSTIRFFVRDLSTGQNLIEQDFGPLPGCNPSGFSPDNSKVAVGFVFNSPITDEMNFPNEPNWALRILDIHSGALVQEINADSPNAPDFESMTEFWFEPNITAMPDTIYFGESSLYFLAFPFVGRDGPPAAPAYRWDFVDNALTEIPNLGNNGASFLAATGEIAYPYLNETFPAAQPMGPVALANEVRIADANGNVKTIYRDTENVIAGVSFVNGGRQLSIFLIPGYDESNPDDVPVSRQILLNRSGEIENLNSASQSYAQTFATSNGLGVLRIEQRQNPDGQYSNFHQIMRYENGQLETVWEYDAPMGASGQVWYELIWASPQAIDPNLAPFVEVN